MQLAKGGGERPDESETKAARPDTRIDQADGRPNERVPPANKGKGKKQC